MTFIAELSGFDHDVNWTRVILKD